MKDLKKQKGFITVYDPVVLPPSGEQPIPGYPFVTCGFAIGNGGTRRTEEPSKTNFACKNFAIHQVIWISAEHYRRARHLEWQGMYAINPNQVHIPHIDIHGIEFEPPNPASPFWFAEDLVHDDASNFDDWVATNKLDSGTKTSMQSFDHMLSYRWDTSERVHSIMAEGIWEQFTNFNDQRTYDEGGANLGRDFGWGIMQDTLAQNASNGIQWYPEYEGTVASAVNANVLRIATWSEAAGQMSAASAHFSGTPVGGYTPNSHELQIIVIRANHTASYSSYIEGHRVVNGSTDEIVLQSSAWTAAPGDEIWVKVRQFQRQPTRRTSNIWNRDLYHIRTVFFLEEVARRNFEEYGIKTGIYSNQVSQNANTKRVAGQADRESMPVPLWQNKWDGIHWEWADQQCGFAGDSAEIGYWVKNSLHGRNSLDYNPDKIPLIIAANTPLLKADLDSANGYPCIWMDIVHVRKLNWDNNGPGVEERYAFLTELDAAYVRFYSLLCWCCDNMAAQAEMGAHADPVTIDEELIYAGDPISPRNFWRNYDQTGNAGQGTWDWRTPAFGTHGYFFEFGNLAIQINLRVPTDINIAWIPSHMSGGQAIDTNLDRCTLPSAGAGFKWQAFNRATYVNNDPDPTYCHYGKTPSDYDFAYIMKDAALNNGADRGATYDTGACEGVIHMRVPV